jgi:hypothetical protein
MRSGLFLIAGAVRHASQRRGGAAAAHICPARLTAAPRILPFVQSLGGLVAIVLFHLGFSSLPADESNHAMRRVISRYAARDFTLRGA